MIPGKIANSVLTCETGMLPHDVVKAVEVLQVELTIQQTIRRMDFAL